MMALNPSIESYFRPIVSSSSPTSSSLIDGDGFTNVELTSTQSSPLDSWIPEKEYEEVDIISLSGGPCPVLIQGRVVNFFDQISCKNGTKKPLSAAGCIKMIVKDDTAAISVRLWYAKKHYEVRLGHLVSIWTPYVSNGEHGSFSIPAAPLFTSIFPERDRYCHILFHEYSDTGNQFRLPLSYNDSSGTLRAMNRPSELMTLKNFISGGFDVANIRLLLCVKGVGARKKISTKKGGIVDVVKVILFDDTGEASLTLWSGMSMSPVCWTPSKTVLMVTNPGWNMSGKQLGLSINGHTMIDVDPAIDDADWLRGFAMRITKKQQINPPFPDEMFDAKVFWESRQKVLFTFADLDEYIREHPFEKIMGFLSVLVLEINLVKYRRRQSLFTNECCGLPLMANTIVTGCKNCESKIKLRVNPQVLGLLIDETGSSTAGRLILSEKAWSGLLGIAPETLADLGIDELIVIEQRVLFTRFTLLFGWTAEEGESGVGRLCIADVQHF